MTLARLRAQILAIPGKAVLKIQPPKFLAIPGEQLTIENPTVAEAADSLEIRGNAGRMNVEALYRGASNASTQIVLRGFPELDNIGFSPLTVDQREVRYTSRPRSAWTFHGILRLGSAILPMVAQAPFTPWNLALDPAAEIRKRAIDPAVLDALFGGATWRAGLPPGTNWRLTQLVVTYVEQVVSVSVTLDAEGTLALAGLGVAAGLEKLQYAATGLTTPYTTLSGTLQVEAFPFDVTLMTDVGRMSGSAEKGRADWGRLRGSALLGGLQAEEDGQVSRGTRFTDVFLEMEYKIEDGRLVATLVEASASTKSGREETWRRRPTV